MKRSLLILVFSVFAVFAVLVALFSLVNYSNSISSQSAEGAHGAYFTEVVHPATVYQGQSCAFSFTVYNKNCTTNGEGNASFFFIFYLDGDVWLNEYTSTSYQTWQCSVGASVMLSYTVPPWFTTLDQPVVHNVSVQLYSHDENVSQLQDSVSFPISAIVHVGLGSMSASIYVILLGIVLLVLGYYMLTHGPVEILSSAKNVTSVSGEQSVTTVSLSRLLSLPFVRFCLFVVASWQMINVLFYASSFPEGLRPGVYLIVEVAYVVILVLLIGRESSSFKGYGFLWPEESLKYVVVSLLLAVFYSFVIIIVPGIFSGYDVYPPVSSAEILSVILLSLVASFAAETIFRGYIQSKLTKLSGFPQALIATSVMFTLYMLHSSPFDFSSFLPEVLSLFVMGIFLGALFYRTKTLLCPVIFYFVASVLESLTHLTTVSSEYSSLFLECVALGLSYILVEVLVLRKSVDLENEEMFFEEMQHAH